MDFYFHSPVCLHGAEKENFTFQLFQQNIDNLLRHEIRSRKGAIGSGYPPPLLLHHIQPGSVPDNLRPSKSKSEIICCHEHTFFTIKIIYYNLIVSCYELLSYRSLINTLP